MTSLRRAKLTLAAFTTDRSVAIASSSRTKPWSRTRIVSSVITWSTVATKSSLTRLYVGTSGWSYPSWRPGFYPAGLDAREFLSFYAQQFRTVELNTTGYRLPSEEQFHRWAAAAPDGFRFAVKLPAHRPQTVAAFEERVRTLGDRLGPVRVSVKSARDEGILELLLGSLSPDLQVAFDLEDPSWDGIEARLDEAGGVRVGQLEGRARFRYLRLREPPYTEAELEETAHTLRALLDQGHDVYCYLRHEDEPTAPRYAERLLELVRPPA